VTPPFDCYGATHNINMRARCAARPPCTWPVAPGGCPRLPPPSSYSSLPLAPAAGREGGAWRRRAGGGAAEKVAADGRADCRPREALLRAHRLLLLTLPPNQSPHNNCGG
jgi:hypothetical protein